MQDEIYKSKKDNSRIMVIDTSIDPIEDRALYHFVNIDENGGSTSGIGYLYLEDLNENYKKIIKGINEKHN